MDFDNNTKIQVLFEDDDLIAVAKPSGLFVHPYHGVSDEKIHLMKLVKNQTGHYLYPIHRLDRPVSGVVLFGKAGKVVAQIKEDWNGEENIKEYLTLVRGKLIYPDEFNMPLKNDVGVPQAARTLYWPLWSNGKISLIRVHLKTGRRHQIRRHFSKRLHNLIGDTAYGKGPINQEFREIYSLKRIFLHAFRMKVFNPVTKKVYDISCPLTEDLVHVLRQLLVDESIIMAHLNQTAQVNEWSRQ